MAGTDVTTEARAILQQPPSAEFVKPDELVHFVERERTPEDLANVKSKAVRFNVALTGKWTTQPLDADLRGIAGQEGAALRHLESMYDYIWTKIWAYGSGHAVMEYDPSGTLHLHLAQQTAKLSDGTVWTMQRGPYEAPPSVLLPMEKVINMNEVVRFLQVVGGKTWLQANTDCQLVFEKPLPPRLTATCMCKSGPRPVGVQNEDGSIDIRMEL